MIKYIFEESFINFLIILVLIEGMQFEILIQQTLENSQNIQQLRNQLTRIQEQCLRKADDDYLKNKCGSKIIHFREYLSAYRAQFKEKGRIMCSQAMSEQKEIGQKIRVKDQCVNFYAKSLPLFESNVVDKLKSLVYNTDFSQL